MTKSDHLTAHDLAAFEAWTEKFWMFIEDKGDALHIWEAASVHTAKRCAALADASDPALGRAIRAEFRID